MIGPKVSVAHCIRDENGILICHCWCSDTIIFIIFFDQRKFWHFWCFPARPSKFNLLKIFKALPHLQVYGEDHPSKSFCQIFENSLSVITPCQNFVLYSKWSMGVLSAIGLDFGWWLVVVCDIYLTRFGWMFQLVSIPFMKDIMGNHEYSV